VPGPYEIDFRIMVGPDIRWISARGRAAELCHAVGATGTRVVINTADSSYIERAKD